MVGSVNGAIKQETSNNRQIIVRPVSQSRGRGDGGDPGILSLPGGIASQKLTALQHIANQL
jgi:hypothetical protein